MQKKPADKAADIKAIVKTTGEKATEKVTETKEIVKEAMKEAVKAAGEKAEETEKKVAEIKSAAKVEESKAAVVVEEAKAAVKKTVKQAAEKKATVKKTDLIPEVFVQFDGREDVVAEVVERAKEAFVADGHKEATIKSLQVYLKPEESTAYYVVNKKYAGKVYLF